MLDVYWLLCICIRTIEHADNTGSLFAFVPEFYLNVAMNAYSALKNYFSPVNSMEELPGTEALMHLLLKAGLMVFIQVRVIVLLCHPEGAETPDSYSQIHRREQHRHQHCC